MYLLSHSASSRSALHNSGLHLFDIQGIALYELGIVILVSQMRKLGLREFSKFTKDYGRAGIKIQNCVTKIHCFNHSLFIQQVLSFHYVLDNISGFRDEKVNKNYKHSLLS